MPRETVQTECQLEHLSILDEEGNVDEELEPELDEQLLRSLHRSMLLSRRFDERMLSMQRQGRLGTFAPVQGQEASQLGAVMVLGEEDWLVPSYRDVAALIWRGAPLQGFLLYNAGYNEGGAVPEDAHFLPIAIPVGTQMLHAAGLGYGLRQRGSDAIVMTFFGDGATSQGDFHEAINFARVFHSPLVLVCENNQYAISVPRSRQTASKTLAQKAFAYDVPCLQVDGNDVLAVQVACQEAAQRAREESMPTLIECLTYRMSVHTTVDDPSKYRSEEEVKQWEPRDPLPRLQRYVVAKGLIDDKGIESLEQDIKQEIDTAVEEAEREMERLDKDQAAMFNHVVAEPASGAKQQREQLTQLLEEQHA